MPRRMARAGAVASVQPAQMILDKNLVVRKLGAERAARSYAFRALLDVGPGKYIGPTKGR